MACHQIVERFVIHIAVEKERTGSQTGDFRIHGCQSFKGRRIDFLELITDFLRHIPKELFAVLGTGNHAQPTQVIQTHIIVAQLRTLALVDDKMLEALIFLQQNRGQPEAGKAQHLRNQPFHQFRLFQRTCACYIEIKANIIQLRLGHSRKHFFKGIFCRHFMTIQGFLAFLHISGHHLGQCFGLVHLGILFLHGYLLNPHFQINQNNRQYHRQCPEQPF